MDTILNILKTRYPGLPADVKSLIDSLPVKVLPPLFAKYSITEDIRDTISTEIFLVLLGMSERADFAKNVADQIGPFSGNSQNITSLTNEVSTTLFAPCSASLDKMIAGMDAASSVAATASVPNDHAPETDTDHMLAAGLTSAAAAAPIPVPPQKKPMPFAIPKPPADKTNPFNLDPQPIKIDVPPAPPAETYPRVTRTLENDAKQETLVAQKLAVATTLAKKDVRIVVPLVDTPRIAGDPYREAPTA